MNIDDSKQYGHFKTSQKNTAISAQNLEANSAHSHSQRAVTLPSGCTLSDKNQ
jgi:hypothetical protein